jgi:hypothetical protein
MWWEVKPQCVEHWGFAHFKGKKEEEARITDHGAYVLAVLYTFFSRFVSFNS